MATLTFNELMVFEFLRPEIEFVAYWLNFSKKFEEYPRIKIFQGINGAKSIYIKCNHHDYAKQKKAWYKPKHTTEVSHEHYILF